MAESPWDSRYSSARYRTPDGSFPNHRRHPVWSLWLILALLSLTTAVQAHNPDTSYTRLKVSAHELEARFTFDIVSLLMLVELDSNRDGQVTMDELQQHAPAIQQYLENRIVLEVDTAPSELGEAQPPEFTEGAETVLMKDYHLTLVHFPFRRELRGLPEELYLGYQIFGELGDRHTILAVIEQEPDKVEEVIFTRFEPDYLYYTGAEYSMAQKIWKFILLGMEHIFIGYDHILFLLALIVVSRFVEMIKIITAFTVAHTCTLALAALEIVKISPRLIEIGIALTIMYVAVENLWAKRKGHRWILTFFFGLIHGFGFANVLRELGLPAAGFARSLIAFNVGVELGQIVIVLIALPLIVALSRWRYGDQTKAGVSVLILLFGLAWFTERAFGLEFMPL